MRHMLSFQKASIVILINSIVIIVIVTIIIIIIELSCLRTLAFDLAEACSNVLIQAAQVRKSSFVCHDEGHVHAYHPETHHSHTIHAGTSVQQVGASHQHTHTMRTFGLCDRGPWPLYCYMVVFGMHDMK